MSNNIGSIDDDDDVDDVTRVARELQICIRDRDLARARQLVESMTLEERMAVTRQKTGNYTPLGMAILYRRASFVRFLLEDCHADVEQLSGVGRYMTPLCVAALYPLDEIAPLLVDYGADVNATGYDQCTPVQVASACGNLKFVRYLVEKGADIQLPNRDGETCLMSSIRDTPTSAVSEYLIEQGASVNAVDNLGDSALHYVVRSQYWLEMRKKRVAHLLLRHGTDTSIRNQSGDDALQTAALHGSPEIIDYLIDKLNPTHMQCADLYSLVAARYVDEFGNFSGAMDLWKESVSIRQQISQDEPMADLNPVYNGAVRVRDVESLEAIADNRDAMYMQALICRERILGRSHCETIHWLTKRALHYAGFNAFQRGIELYAYASQSCGPDSLHPVRGMVAHSEFVWLLTDEERDGSVRFDDAAIALKMVVELSKLESDSSSRMSGISQYILFTSIQAIDLLCRLKSSDAESRSLKQLVRELLQSRCKIKSHGRILRLALESPPDYMCSSAVVEELLEAGADANAVDSAGDTALHLTVRMLAVRYEWRREFWLEVVDLLLRHGAHIDIRNFRGQTAADGLPSTVDKMQYTALQCLAARAIRQHGVTYHNILPTSMTQFVDLH